MSIKEMAKERDEALLSLDKKKIMEFALKYKIQLPSNEISFWAGVHKAILILNSASEEQKNNSFTWLITNGFNPMIKVGE